MADHPANPSQSDWPSPLESLSSRWSSFTSLPSTAPPTPPEQDAQKKDAPRRARIERAAGRQGKIPAATYSPTRKPCSTIGSEGLNFRVRDGNGWDPFDVATGNLRLRELGVLERSLHMRKRACDGRSGSTLASAEEPRG